MADLPPEMVERAARALHGDSIDFPEDQISVVPGDDVWRSIVRAALSAAGVGVLVASHNELFERFCALQAERDTTLARVAQLEEALRGVMSETGTSALSHHIARAALGVPPD